MRRRGKRSTEHQRRKQAIAAGLLPHTGHRSHVSGKRWLRPWVSIQWQGKMSKMK